MTLNRNYYFVLLIFILLHIIVIGQTPGITATDYDGNSYNSVIIGNQTWLAENLKSTHYCDGTDIPDVVSYNNDVSLADVYGLLYTWDATMNGSNIPSSQGACPCGWHVPSDEEWKELEDFLGGAVVAGGKMKEIGTTHWKTPNTGADNSSGLTFLPGGEYDANSSPKKFSLLNEYAVLWTSAEVNSLKARERYLAYNDAKSSIYDWYKTMKYSIRCVKDTNTTAINDGNANPIMYALNQNYPNPFNPTTTIEYNLPISEEINISVYNVLGNKINELYNGVQTEGSHSVSLSGVDMPTGFYIYKLETTNRSLIKSCLLLK